MKVKQIRLEDPILEEIKQLADSKGKSANSVIREAILQYLESQKKDPEKSYTTEAQVKEMIAKELQRLSKSNKEQMRKIAQEEINKSSNSKTKAEEIPEEGISAFDFFELEKLGQAPKIN